VLQAFALFTDRLGWAAPLPAEIARASDICALLGGALSPLLLAPEPTPSGRRGLLGALVAVVTLGTLLLALVTQFDLVQTLALYGFRLDLPPLATPGAVTYVALVLAAFVGMAMTVVWTLADRNSRTVGYGLVLLFAAGYQALAPNQVLFALCGLLSLAGSVAGAAHAQPRSSASLLGAEAAGL
jgi:hypothetical protein